VRSSNRCSRPALLVLGSFVLTAVGCQSDAPDQSQAGAQAESASGSTVDGPAMLSYLERTIDIAHEKFVDLAEAMPEQQYDWRPMEGVRSVGEVFVHVAADNWYGPALLDIRAPDGVGVTTEPASVRAYQERSLTKAEIISELDASFQHVLEAARSTRDQVGNQATLGGNTITYGDLWVRLITHMHEHLGQSIAYARSNEIVPPWSR
jgi:uncharacterized damage-inducible protein DinB